MENDKQKIKLEELEKRVNSLSKKVQTNVYAIGEMDSLVNKLVEKASYSDYDRFIYPCKRKSYDSLKLDVIHFVCKPGFLTKVVIKIKVCFKGNVELSGKLRVYWDRYAGSDFETEMIKEYSGITEEFSEEVIFEKTFFPTKGYYCFRIHASSSATNASEGYCGIDYADISIYGVNIEILNRNLDLKVFHGNHSYYITQTKIDGYYYAKGSPFNFKKLKDLTFNKVEKLIPNTGIVYQKDLEAFNVTYIPFITCDRLKTYYLVDVNDTGKFAFSTDCTNSVYEGVNNPEDGTYLIPVGPIGSMYSVAPPTSLVRSGIALLTYSAIDLPNCYAYTSMPNESGASYSSRQLRCNNVCYETRSIEASTVVAKDWMNRATLRPNCYFIVNYLGEINFFYGYNSPSKLRVGVGHQVNAYMQSDRSITVYFTYLRNVYRRTLCYDSTTDSYSLDTSVRIFPGTLEYIEGKSTDYFTKTDGWNYYHR